MIKLSVIIITRDEEANIADCLESVSWADEIIVLDSGSTDKTVDICKQYTAKVYSMDWPGFGPQKQRALDKAQGEWVLSIDADERIPQNLKQEIQTVINTRSEVNGYYLPRLSHVCGQPIRHSGWYPDYIIRLFKRDKAKFSKDVVHEKVLLEGKTAKLKNHILHFSYTTYKQVIDKYNMYSELGAQKLFYQGKKASFFKAVSSALMAFVKLYILKRGFLDGKIGFIVAVTSAETAFYKYLKLIELNKKLKS